MPRAADDLIVGIFWSWFVRNPAFCAAGIALFAAAAGIIGWSLALAAAAVLAILGDIAWHFARIADAAAERRYRKREEAQLRAKQKAEAEAAQRFAEFLKEHENAA